MDILLKLLRESYDLQEQEPNESSYWHLQKLRASIKDAQIKDESKVNNVVLDNVNERNIAKYDYVWHNGIICKVVDLLHWSDKHRGVKVEILDLTSRKNNNVSISSLRYVR